MSYLQWAMGPDTGVSSMTILSALTGTPMRWQPDIPYDGDDFGRCHRLLQTFPTFRHRLAEVAAQHPKWGPIIEAWDELTALYLEDIPTGRLTKSSDRLAELRDACMLADGWEREGKSGWRKPQEHMATLGNMTVVARGFRDDVAEALLSAIKKGQP